MGCVAHHADPGFIVPDVGDVDATKGEAASRKPRGFRASMNRILQPAYRAGPPLPPAIASARCSLFLRGHIQLDRQIFLSPAERQSPGGAPRRRPRRIAGGWTRGSGPGSVAPSRAVAASAAQARSRREFASSFRIRLHRSYIAHRPEDRVVPHELVRAPGCQRAGTALYSFEPRQAAERQPNRRSLLDVDGRRHTVHDFTRKCPKRVQWRPKTGCFGAITAKAKTRPTP